VIKLFISLELKFNLQIARQITLKVSI
jgi:hypothetical protein